MRKDLAGFMPLVTVSVLMLTGCSPPETVDGIVARDNGYLIPTSTLPSQVPYWQVDLGDEHDMSGLKLSFGGNGNPAQFVAVPKTIDVQVADRDPRCGAEVTSVRTIAAEEIPEPGDAYTTDLAHYALPAGTHGRYVRLSLPDGAKPHPGGVLVSPNGTTVEDVDRVAFGEVEVLGTGPATPATGLVPCPTTASTAPATGVGMTAATLRGTINPNGYPASYHFEYGTSISYGARAPAPDGRLGSDSDDHELSETIVDLAPATTYHYRLVATTQSGHAIVEGEDRTFTTHEAPTIVTTGPASEIGPASATVTGTINPKGLPTKYHFEYGQYTTYGHTAPVPDVDVGSDDAEHDVTAVLPLAPGSTWHYRLVAVLGDNAAIEGDDQTLTTPDVPTSATTGPAVDPTATGATLRGAINPAGLQTQYRFEYGPDTSYGQTTPDGDVGSDESDHDVTAAATGLAPGLTWHYRVVATVNGFVVAEGEDRTFETLPARTVVTTGAATELGTTTATLTGTINPMGTETAYHFEYGADTRYGSKTPNSDGPVGSDSSAHDVTAVARRLAAQSTYHYRLVATVNGYVVARGEDRTFTTASPCPDAPASSGPAEVTLEGSFGRVSVSTVAPSLTSLRLRQPDGTLSRRSLLTPNPGSGFTYFNTGGDQPGSYDSRHACLTAAARITRTGRHGPARSVELSFVPYEPTTYEPGPAVERWKLSVGSSGMLSWRVNQRWTRAAQVTDSGTPSLRLGSLRSGYGLDPTSKLAGVTTTLWVDPSEMSFPQGPSGAAGSAIVKKPDTWAIYKLLTDVHEQSDLRLSTSGGHLFRRGGFMAEWSEIGSVIAPTLGFDRVKDAVNASTLELSPVDKFDTGIQLAVKTPDERTTSAMQDLLGSMYNGGAVRDNQTFDFGNESDSNASYTIYAGSAWMQGMALAAGVVPARPLATDPMDIERAFHDRIENILATVDEEGLGHFGYIVCCYATDQDLHTVMGAHNYLVYSGDLVSARKWMPAIERILGYFLRHRDANGLYVGAGAAAHYYDGVAFNGESTYYQAFGYKALLDGAAMEEALGNAAQAKTFRAEAAKLKTAINDVLWNPNAPGGPRYTDWIATDGTRHEYFIDMFQYPTIVFGIAPPQRAKQLLATADRRMAELVDEYGYTREATISSLWDQPPEVHIYGDIYGPDLGTYQNGGSLLAMTYWEVVARSMVGQVDGTWGAYRLLRRYGGMYNRNAFVGDNSVDIRGRIKDCYFSSLGIWLCGDTEPYLSDAIATPASLVNGILGIKPTWKTLEIDPHLPAGWRNAEACLNYRGGLYRITVTDRGKHKVTRVHEAARCLADPGHRPRSQRHRRGRARSRFAAPAWDAVRAGDPTGRAIRPGRWRR